MSQEDEDAIEEAVRRLLRASQEFTRAYEAWVDSPRTAETQRRMALDDAERRMAQAQRAVASMQTRKLP